MGTGALKGGHSQDHAGDWFVQPALSMRVPRRGKAAEAAPSIRRRPRRLKIVRPGVAEPTEAAIDALT